MSLNQRYLQGPNDELFSFWWNTNPSGQIVAVCSTPTPFDYEAGSDPSSMPVPTGCTELNESDYNSAIATRQSTRSAQHANSRQEMSDKHGILNNLIDNADTLLGSIL